MKYLLFIISVFVWSASWLQAQDTKFKNSDISEGRFNKCVKMLHKAQESMDDEDNLTALKLLDEIIAYEPKFPWSYTNKILALFILDSLDECLKLCKASYDTYGDNNLSWLFTGKIYKGMKKYDEALRCFVESFKKDPCERSGLFARLRLLVELNRSKDALSEICVIANHAKYDAELWGMLSWVHLRMNNLDSALYYAEEGISGKGSNYIAYNVLGEVYYTKGDLKKAIKYYGRVNNDNEYNYLDDEIFLQSVMTLASLHLLAGEYDDGISDLKRIKKFEPRRRVAIPYLYLRICLDAMQNKNTDADVQKFKSLLSKDIGLEWDFSKTDAWLAKATLTPQQRTLIEDITKRFKEYVGKK